MTAVYDEILSPRDICQTIYHAIMLRGGVGEDEGGVKAELNVFLQEKSL